jgi:hypothetical protein
VVVKYIIENADKLFCLHLGSFVRSLCGCTGSLGDSLSKEMASNSRALDILGKGFFIPESDDVNFSDISVENCLTDVLLSPREEFLKHDVPNRLYSGDIRETSKHYQSRRRLRVSFQTNITAVVPVTIEAEMAWQSTETREEHIRYCVEQMHTRTIRFKREVIRNMPRLLSEDSQLILGPRTADDLGLMMPSVKEANVLYESLTQRHTSDRPKEETCKELLSSERLSGATYFVSAVHLGAKVIDIRRTNSHTTQKEEWENLLGSVYAAGGGIDKLQSISNRLKESQLRQMTLKHPDVNFDGERTRIEENQEVVIGYELSPITLLVSKEWTSGLRNTCIEHLYDKQHHCLHVPGKDTDDSFLLVAGTFWLKVDIENKQILATKDVKEASPFHIIPESEGSSSFYIEHRSGSIGGRRYLSLVDQEPQAALVDNSKSNEVRFRLVRPRDGKEVRDLSEWSTEPLKIKRKTKIFSWRKTLYLCVLPDEDGQTGHVMSSHSSPPVSAFSQFHIRTPLQLR